jgi:O-antigen biosynthesis protein
MGSKYKIAIYYDNRWGRNDGPPRYYLNAMEGKMHMDVHHLIPYEQGVDRQGPYDLHIWVDWGEDAVLGREQALIDGIPDDGGKKIYIVSDAHIDDGYRFRKASQFDYVFFNQDHYVDQYAEYVKQGHPAKNREQAVMYLPHASEPDIFYNFNKDETALIKKYDLCFIGHIQEYHKDNTLNLTRVDVLDHVFKQIPNFYFGSRNSAYPDKNIFQDAAKRFCESKVVFNISIGNDLNMRFFEVLSTGSFLLTNWIPELKSAEEYGFIDGVHYISYKSLEEAVEKARYYIEHDEERELIAGAGYKQALKAGTYEARVKEIFDKLGLPITEEAKIVN